MNRPESRPDDDALAASDAASARSAPAVTEPVFAEPWQAQAFALVESLREGGLFTAADWSAALGRALASRSASTGGDDDYHACWLDALERLLAERDVVAPAELETTAAAWERAAHATPHGQPILLENDPEGGAAPAPC